MDSEIILFAKNIYICRMRYAFILLVVFTFGCKKSAQQSYTFSQILDSMGIVPGHNCLILGVPNDTVIFNSDATVTEICHGYPISYKLSYSLIRTGKSSMITLKSLCDSDLSQSPYYYFTSHFENETGYTFITGIGSSTYDNLGTLTLIK